MVLINHLYNCTYKCIYNHIRALKGLITDEGGFYIVASGLLEPVASQVVVCCSQVIVDRERADVVQGLGFRFRVQGDWTPPPPPQ